MLATAAFAEVMQAGMNEVWLYQMSDERRSDALQTPLPCGLRANCPQPVLIGLEIVTAITCTSRLDCKRWVQQHSSRGILTQVLNIF